MYSEDRRLNRIYGFIAVIVVAAIVAGVFGFRYFSARSAFMREQKRLSDETGWEVTVASAHGSGQVTLTGAEAQSIVDSAKELRFDGRESSGPYQGSGDEVYVFINSDRHAFPALTLSREGESRMSCGNDMNVKLADTEALYDLACEALSDA